MIRYRLEDDGIKHINCYSQGKTELGRLLSNFAHTPFVVNGHMGYASIEAAWYSWAAKGSEEDLRNLRSTYGFRAKQLGRLMADADYPKGDPFRVFIKTCLEAKLKATPRLQELLKANTLPLVHYYVYGGKVVESPGSDWVWEHWTMLALQAKQLK